MREMKVVPRKIPNLKGYRQGRLVVVGYSHHDRLPSGKSESFWQCICDCGTSVSVRRTSLYGQTKSCGCLQKEVAAAQCRTHPKLMNGARKHGKSHTKEYRKQASLKKQFGITLEQYNEMLIKQGSVCAICGGNDAKDLAVDHNHKTGEIRGLLCASCNIGLGFFKDSKNLLDNAKDYLDKKWLLNQNNEMKQLEPLGCPAT